MAPPKYRSQKDTTRNIPNGSRTNDEQRDGVEYLDAVTALLENPQEIIAGLHEEIGRLASALIDARFQLVRETGATRQDVALDLYDEELITKRDVMESGGIDRGDFFDLLINRRQVRMRVKQD